jgi:hypothetical protein
MAIDGKSPLLQPLDSGKVESLPLPAAKPAMSISRNEEFWVELIREASGDRDPEPNLRTVQAVRAIFRGFRLGGRHAREV